MTRFTKAVELVSVALEQDAYGGFSEVETVSKAFGNRMTVGATAWAAARSTGLHADGSVQLRSCDYAGQERLRMDGVEYEVERAVDSGEFTVLTLARRLSND